MLLSREVLSYLFYWIIFFFFPLFFKEVEITKTEGKIEDTFHDVAPILSHNTLEIVFYLV